MTTDTKRVLGLALLVWALWPREREPIEDVTVRLGETELGPVGYSYRDPWLFL